MKFLNFFHHNKLRPKKMLLKVTETMRVKSKLLRIIFEKAQISSYSLLKSM